MYRVRLSVTAVLLALAACGGDSIGATSGTESVVAAFYPLEFAAERVGGERVSVESLTPSGVEPHDLELSARQIGDLTDADLVIYLGGGFQPAVEDALAEIDGPVKFDALSGAEPLEATEDEGSASGVDPHVWLDPTRMAEIVDGIARQLAELDPDGAALYQKNAWVLHRQLSQLDRDYAGALQHCGSREIVTSHAAFGYLAARYGLEQVSVAGIDPEAEPSPGRLAEVIDFITQHHIDTIFFEELAPPDLAETLARETGAKAEVLSPLETRPDEGDYIDAMQANLDRLRTALGCD
jgi:zinc transport system substrate-binding protein